jgi:putative hydrolase of the HAD superfamily
MQAFRDMFFGGDVIDRSLVETIRSLRGNFHTGLISNAWSGLREFITKENVIDVFETIVISAEVGVVKPSAGIYELALKQANVKADEAVFVDDMPVNIEACEKVGMKGVLFNDPQESLKRLNQLLKI